MFAFRLPPGDDSGVEKTADTASLLKAWLAGLDARGLDEAWGCLHRGTYTGPLLRSLRAALPSAPAVRHGLDDPHTSAAGDPLGSAVQTTLREYFFPWDGLRIGPAAG